jgi:6-phosphogluconolactonase (cycloisomerase 2 family)
MIYKVILTVTAATLVLVSIGCSTSGCPSATPGTTGTASGTASGKLIPNPCPVPANSTYSALLYSLNASGTALIASGQDSSGSLVSLSSFTSPTFPTSQPQAMAIVNKQFLYIPMGDTTIQAFGIDRSTGALSTIVGSPYTVPTTTGTATSAVADPQGRFLFVGSNNTGEVWAYEIDSKSGVLTLIAGSPFSVQFTFSRASSLTVDATGRFLYVGQGDPSLGVIAFSIDQVNGMLSQLAGTPFHLGVAQLRADPAAEFLAGTAQIQNQSGPAAPDTRIYRFAIESNGVPTPVAGSPFQTTFAPYDLITLPNGKFIFTFGTNPSTHQQGAIEGFQVNTQTGALATIAGSPFTGLPTVYTCQLDQSGTHSFCIDALPGTKFSVLSIDSVTGAVTHTGTDLIVNNAFPFALTE